MARGGKRPGAGRPKGAATRMNEEARAKAAASGEMPLDYMLRVMRNPEADTARRDDMAKAAAGFLHAKLAAVEVTGETTVRTIAEDPLSPEEWAAQYAGGEATTH